MIKRQTTKELIAASLNELLNELPFSKITIKKITDNCGLTPTTFYKHFSDKYALVQWTFDTAQSSYVDRIDDSYTWYHACRDMLYSIKEYRNIYERILKNDELHAAFVQINYTQCIKAIKKIHHIESIPADILFAMKIFFYGETAVMSDIITSKTAFHPPQLAFQFLDSMPQDVRHLVCPSWDTIKPTITN